MNIQSCGPFSVRRLKQISVRSLYAGKFLNVYAMHIKGNVMSVLGRSQ
jgi:hypothetical protein